MGGYKSLTMAQPTDPYITDPDLIAAFEAEPEKLVGEIDDPEIVDAFEAAPERLVGEIEDEGIAEQFQKVEQRDKTRATEAAVRSQLKTQGGVGLAGKQYDGVEGFKQSVNDKTSFTQYDNEANKAIAKYGGREQAKVELQREYDDYFNGDAAYRATNSNPGVNYNIIDAIEKQEQNFKTMGVTDPKEMDRLLADAAKENEWTEQDTDRVRKLSTGEIVINPARVFGDYEGMKAEIKRTATSEEDRAEGVARLDRMRAAMADSIDSANSVEGGAISSIIGWATDRDNYNEFASKLAGQGVTNKVDVIDRWSKQQKDRNWIFKLGDAVETGVTSGSIGIGKSAVGTAAGLTAVVGMDDTATALASNQQFLGDTVQSLGEASAERGSASGAYGVAQDLANTTTQMAPMFIGGWAAGGLNDHSVCTMTLARTPGRGGRPLA